MERNSTGQAVSAGPSKFSGPLVSPATTKRAPEISFSLFTSENTLAVGFWIVVMTAWRDIGRLRSDRVYRDSDASLLL
jgi:hypothetical protein